MEHTTEPAPQENLPSGTMVREHWNNWRAFTSMTKAGIVVVGLVTLGALLFITGSPWLGLAGVVLAIICAAVFVVMR